MLERVRLHQKKLKPYLPLEYSIERRQQQHSMLYPPQLHVESISLTCPHAKSLRVFLFFSSLLPPPQDTLTSWHHNTAFNRGLEEQVHYTSAGYLHCRKAWYEGLLSWFSSRGQAVRPWTILPLFWRHQLKKATRAGRNKVLRAIKSICGGEDVLFTQGAKSPLGTQRSRNNAGRSSSCKMV